MRAGATGLGAAQSDNLKVMPGVVMRPITQDAADLLLAGAGMIEGLGMHADAVVNALPVCTPTSVRERLAALAGQIAVLASAVERDALNVQGCWDAADVA